MAWTLRIIEPKGERRIALRHVAVVGRDPSCELPLDDPLVSRRHIRLHPETDGGLRVEELGSRNGATRNGVPIEGAVALEAGDRIELGSCTLVVEAAGAAEGEDSPATHGEGGIEPSSRLREEPAEPKAPAGARFARGPVVFSTRKRLALIACLALSLLLALAWSIGGRSGGGPGGGSWPLDPETAGLVFGWGPEAEIASPASLHFEWHPSVDPHTHLIGLRYESLHEAGAEGLEVRLNGAPIAAVGGSGLGWTEEALPLPRQLIRPGAPNRISFVHLPNERGAREAWLVSGIALFEEALPTCERARCLQEAADRLEQGELFLARRHIDARNLLHARRAFRQGLLHLETLDPKPDLYGVTQERLRETEGLLGKRCRDMRFRVVRRIAFGEERAAAEEAARMARFFSEEDHPCHRSARRFLEMLE